MSVFEENLSPGTPALLGKTVGVDEEANFMRTGHVPTEGADTDDVIRTCTSQLTAHPEDARPLPTRQHLCKDEKTR